MSLRDLGFAVLGAAVLLTAASTRAAPPDAGTSRTAQPEPQSYVLGPADVIEVSVLGRPDFTTKGRIDDDGTFRVPFLGPVVAANKTPTQLSDDLARALDAGGYFTKPIVKVEVAEYASKYVTVLGSVNKPDLVPVDRAYRLSEIMARAGGIREGGSDYVVYRPKNGPERRISMQAMATGDLHDDPYVSPGDKVYVPEADVVYVSGQVRTPGAFPLKSDMTFRMAISRAGGLTDSGSDKSVTLTRNGKKIKHLDLDTKVMPGDTIVVGERLF
jgi:polysaccharide export outer membrane protein